MTDWLVVQVMDERGGAVTPSAAALEGAGVSHALSDVAGQGWSVALAGVAAGKYQLNLTLPQRLPLPLAVEVKARGAGKLVVFRGKSPAIATLSSQAVTAGGPASRTLHVVGLKLPKQHSEVVLVAGWDYSGGADNTLYAKTWRDDLYAGQTFISGKAAPLTKQIHDHTVVSLFDFKSGQRIRWLKARQDWHELDRVLQGSVPTHTGYYKDAANTQKRHDDDAISIRHVYDYIADLGAAAPGSVQRFDIFSHAWAGGPILVDTVEDAVFAPGGSRSTERDPGDKDGRTKDFSTRNMPRRAQFKRAFAAGGIAKVWGCFATTDYRRLVRGAAQAPNKTTKFKVQMLDGSEVEVTGQQVENYFKNSVLPETYMAQMGDAVSIKVYGAPPGMGADLRAVGRRNYMFVNQSDYRLEYRWYKDALGLAPDESGHFPF